MNIENLERDFNKMHEKFDQMFTSEKITEFRSRDLKIVTRQINFLVSFVDILSVDIELRDFVGIFEMYCDSSKFYKNYPHSITNYMIFLKSILEFYYKLSKKLKVGYFPTIPEEKIIKNELKHVFLYLRSISRKLKQLSEKKTNDNKLSEIFEMEME